MKATFSSAAILAAAGAVSAQSGSCPEAARFGGFTLNTTTLIPGQTVSVNADFACGVQLGYIPQYVNYYLQPPNYNPNDATSTDNADLPILISRAQVEISAEQPWYNSTFVVPHANFAYSSYSYMMWGTYQNAPATYLSVGGIGAGVTIGTSA